MAKARVWSIAGAMLLLLVLTGCTTGVPDPQANAVVPAAARTTTQATTRATTRTAAQAIAADPSLSVISGTVLTTHGRPVPDAVVVLRQALAGHGCGRCGRLAAAVTGADGSFSLAVPDGEYSTVCSTSGATTCRISPTADVRQADLRVEGPISGLRFIAPVLERSHPR